MSVQYWGGYVKVRICISSRYSILPRLDFVIDRWFFFNSHRFHNFSDGAFTHLILPSQSPLAQLVRLAQLAMISHRSASVQRVAIGSIRFPLRFIESKGPENHLNKVRTCQLSAHQRLQFTYCQLTISSYIVLYLFTLDVSFYQA